MRLVKAISIACIIAGAGLLPYAVSLPLYTDATAPERLSGELEKQPSEIRSEEWYLRLATYETPRKRLADLGRGLLAAGAGLLVAARICRLYDQAPRRRTAWAVFLSWVALWALRIPLSMWYYGLRQYRFDYPPWADSIAIPVASESITWIVGALLSSLVLWLLLWRHPLPEKIELARPGSVWTWIRSAFLWCWMAGLAACVVSSVPDGDEGMVFTCTVACAILLVFASAREFAMGQNRTPA